MAWIAYVLLEQKRHGQLKCTSGQYLFSQNNTKVEFYNEPLKWFIFGNTLSWQNRNNIHPAVKI